MKAKFRYGQKVRLKKDWPQDFETKFYKKGKIAYIRKFSGGKYSLAFRPDSEGDAAWFPESMLEAVGKLCPACGRPE